MASFLELYKTETGNFLKQVLNGNVKARVKKYIKKQTESFRECQQITFITPNRFHLLSKKNRHLCSNGQCQYE